MEHDIYLLGYGTPAHRAMKNETDHWDDWRKFDAVDSLQATWTAPALRWWKPGESGLSGDSKRKPLPTDTDMPITFGALMTIVSERFVNSDAGAALAPFGEYLPTKCAEGTFFIYHCMNVIDALDEARAEVGRSRSSGAINNVYKYAFHAERIPEECAFRLPYGNQYLVHLTASINARLHAAGLSGILTEPVKRV